MSIIPPNFQSILNIEASEANRPPLPPMGTYVFLVKDPPEFGTSSQKGTPYVKFTLTATQPYEDVDEEDLEKAGGIAKMRALPVTFYISDAANYRLKEFMVHCGIEEGNFQEMIPQVQGREVLGTIRHEPSRDNTTTYANIKSTAPLPE